MAGSKTNCGAYLRGLLFEQGSSTLYVVFVCVDLKSLVFLFDAGVVCLVCDWNFEISRPRNDETLKLLVFNTSSLKRFLLDQLILLFLSKTGYHHLPGRDGGT